MNREQMLLILLAEECAEVQQRVTKALRFGMTERQPGQDQNNRQRLEGELHDLLAIIAMLENDVSILVPSHFEELEKKFEKVEWYLKYSKQLGVMG